MRGRWEKESGMQQENTESTEMNAEIQASVP